jgi:hypothetical protein
MPHPDPELLAALALGDLEDVPAETRAHVEGCETCRHEVEQLRRTLSLAREGAGDRLIPPPAAVWDRIAAEVAAGPAPARTPAAPVAGAPSAGPTPPSAPPASSRRSARRRRVPLWGMAVAASVTLVAGLAGGWALGRAAQDEPAPMVLAHADLHTLTGHADRGSAEVVRRDDHLVLWISSRAIDGAPGLHEVWLINTDGKRMVSVGLLGPSGGRFDVPKRLLDEGYRIVDISVEPDDGNPAHSGDSVARGELSF